MHAYFISATLPLLLATTKIKLLFGLTYTSYIYVCIIPFESDEQSLYKISYFPNHNPSNIGISNISTELGLQIGLGPET